MKDLKIFVVRPYADEIRTRMFKTLSELGGKISERWIAPILASPGEIIDLLEGAQPDVFLIPFHQGTDAQDKSINGLKTIALLMETYPGAEKIPVLTPVSKDDRHAFEPTWEWFLKLHPEHKILVLHEEEILGDGLGEKISGHLAG